MSLHNCSKSVCQLYLIWKYRKGLKQHCVFVSFLKFEAFTTVGSLIKVSVQTVQNSLQSVQLFHCIQHIFVSAVSSLNLKLYCSCRLK